jgi:hypothetical protein
LLDIQYDFLIINLAFETNKILLLFAVLLVDGTCYSTKYFCMIFFAVVYTCPGGSRVLANKLGLPQDPLIIKAIRRPREKKIEIHRGTVPSLNKFAKIRDEDFGCIIYDFNTMYPVAASKTWVEELFNLKQPVEALAENHGNDVWEFIAALSDAGLVEFNYPDSALKGKNRYPIDFNN